MLDIIIKNGECYIDGTLKKKDIGILKNKIVKIVFFIVIYITNIKNQ